MVKYDKLWELMKNMGLRKSDLLTVITAPTVSSLVQNKYVKLSTIENICKFLNCTANDVMEFDEDMTHVSWRKNDDGYNTQFTEKKIIPAEELLIQEDKE